MCLPFNVIGESKKKDELQINRNTHQNKIIIIIFRVFHRNSHLNFSDDLTNKAIESESESESESTKPKSMQGFQDIEK